MISELAQKLRVRQVSHSGLQLEIQFATDVLRLSPGDRNLIRQAKQSSSTDDFLQWANSLISSNHGHYTILVGHSHGKGPTAYVGHHRVALVEGRIDDPSTVAMVKSVVESVYSDPLTLQRVLSNIGQHREKVDADSMRQMKASQGYQISFTLVNPNPAELEASWDIEAATDGKY
ncbi:hypothetical protein EMCRGX_G023784 [Ephydatia muelleri]